VGICGIVLGCDTGGFSNGKFPRIHDEQFGSRQLKNSQWPPGRTGNTAELPCGPKAYGAQQNTMFRKNIQALGPCDGELTWIMSLRHVDKI
jgi:hypothetical protein